MDMNKRSFLGLGAAMAVVGCNRESHTSQKGNGVLTKTEDSPLTYTLPSPKTDGDMSVEKTMANRRSRRIMLPKKALAAAHLSQILWAAYGVTRPMPDRPSGGLHTAPSAGAIFPMEIYVVIGNVTGIEAGLYKYISRENKIVRTIDKDIRKGLGAAALNQTMLRDAPATVVYTATFDRMIARYGERGRDRYVFIEIGHSAQNVYLQAEALGLGTCAVAAFDDEKISELLNLPETEKPFYLMPVGYFN